MPTINMFVLTSGQSTAAMGFNSPPVAIEPRAIDSATPGSGINLNENADGWDAGDPVTLTGMFVAPVRIVNDPAYLTNAPDMVTYLLDKPFCLLESETIFLPPEEI